MFSPDLSKKSYRSDVIDNGHILLLENEEPWRDILSIALEEQGYKIMIAQDSRDALPSISNTGAVTGEFPFSLLILDATNGLDLCRMLRHHGQYVPILIIGNKENANNCAFYLEAGADDYLTKPFSIREFIARCRALIRRQRIGKFPGPVMLQYKDIILYQEECRVIVRGEEVQLSPKQFRLLELFLSYPRRVWSREQLLDVIWGTDFVGDSKTVDVHIRWLREKLEVEPSKPEYIITVRGFGYRFG
ncbi:MULTISPECIES: winged helix-turn-helix domain-containing protein [Limnospira]|uniref:winged helix-turn-helix domain-containing protein n=1 Tax=Limnospira TaxID=2596745 RepID=UPI000280421F|nr:MULTISPECIES: response regulator transcription factor [Limnospira]EKD07407.1 two component transcriptional regulator winged helix family [Arthrospira platensis C1]MDT9235949.1 response regulator transcription factor [Limnospira sp. PMC 917.15]MDT9276846.1 response regulator transcription factor [Limnospira sp. PMC 737.11]QNH56194.1 MAG: response regulator transcription factor [Limnospira indica BM01]UWU47637.1 two-component system, OmpR family, phosphate regulon response regulator PhoB [Art